MAIVSEAQENRLPSRLFMPRDASIRVRWRLFTSPERQRLLAELAAFDAILQLSMDRKDPDGWRERAINFYNQAQAAFELGQHEVSWRCLQEAERLIIFISNDRAFNTTRTIVQARGEKVLTGWRRKAFKQLIKKSQKNDCRKALYEASCLIGDFQETRFYGIRLARMHTMLIACILLALCALFFVAVCFLPPDQNRQLTTSGTTGSLPIYVLAGSFLMGGIGACISALMSLPTVPQNIRIPDRLMNFIGVVARPIVGGASGLVGAILLLSNIFHFGSISVELVFVMSFAFGFSERLVFSTVNSVAGRSIPSSEGRIASPT